MLDLISLLEELLVAERVLPGGFAYFVLGGPFLRAALGEGATPTCANASTIVSRNVSRPKRRLERQQPVLDVLPEDPGRDRARAPGSELMVVVGDHEVLEVTEAESLGADRRCDERESGRHRVDQVQRSAP